MVKPMARDHADMTLLQQCPSEQLAQQLPLSASVAAPEALSSAAQLDQEVFTMLEVSTHMRPLWDLPPPPPLPCLPPIYMRPSLVLAPDMMSQISQCCLCPPVVL